MIHNPWSGEKSLRVCPICYGKGYYIDKLWFETVKRKCTMWCRVKAWLK
jgi:hypothetical protein